MGPRGGPQATMTVDSKTRYAVCEESVILGLKIPMAMSHAVEWSDRVVG